MGSASQVRSAFDVVAVGVKAGAYPPDPASDDRVQVVPVTSTSTGGTGTGGRGRRADEDEACRAERLFALSKLYEPEGPVDLDELTGPVYWPDLTRAKPARRVRRRERGPRRSASGSLIWTTKWSPAPGSSTPVMSKPSRRSATRSESPAPRSLPAPQRSTGTGPACRCDGRAVKATGAARRVRVSTAEPGATTGLDGPLRSDAPDHHRGGGDGASVRSTAATLLPDIPSFWRPFWRPFWRQPLCRDLGLLVRPVPGWARPRAPQAPAAPGRGTCRSARRATGMAASTMTTAAIPMMAAYP